MWIAEKTIEMVFYVRQCQPSNAILNKKVLGLAKRAVDFKGREFNNCGIAIPLTSINSGMVKRAFLNPRIGQIIWNVGASQILWSQAVKGLKVKANTTLDIGCGQL